MILSRTILRDPLPQPACLDSFKHGRHWARRLCVVFAVTPCPSRDQQLCLAGGAACYMKNGLDATCICEDKEMTFDDGRCWSAQELALKPCMGLLGKGQCGPETCVVDEGEPKCIAGDDFFNRLCKGECGRHLCCSYEAIDSMCNWIF